MKRLVVLGLLTLSVIAVLSRFADAQLTGNQYGKAPGGWATGRGDSPITGGKILDSNDLSNALGGGSEARGKVFQTEGANSVTLYFDVDEVAPDAITDVSFYCEGAIDSSGTGGWKRIVGEAYAAGTVTLVDATYVFATTADDDFRYVLTVADPWVRCSFDMAGAGAGNSGLDVWAWLSVL